MGWTALVERTDTSRLDGFATHERKEHKKASPSSARLFLFDRDSTEGWHFDAA